MRDVFAVGDQPIPGYRLLESQGGTAFFRLWKVSAPDGSIRQWKEIDLVVGNAAVETRTLGLLVQLRHPRLNTLTNFWQLNNGETLIIESELPNMSLRHRLTDYLPKGSGIPPQELHQYIAQAAEGLDFLNAPQHQFQGKKVAVYHRALRPESLLLFNESGQRVCKVSDFGLAKPVTEQVAQHSQGLLHYEYDPPEFFEGQTASTSDQYSLAIVYYELRTGKLPFNGTMLEQLQARLNDAPALELLGEPERSIVRKALSREPGQRYESCTDFAKRLQSNRAPEGIRSLAPPVRGATFGMPTAAARPAASAAPIGGGLTAVTRNESNGVARPGSTLGSLSALGAGMALASSAPAGGAAAGVVFHRAPGEAARTTSESHENGVGSHSAPANVATVAAAEAHVPATIRPTAPPPTSDIKSIRQQLSGAAATTLADEPNPAEAKIPLVWVGIILLATAWLAMYITQALMHH